MNRLLIICIVLVCFLYSCHPAKNIQTAIAKKDSLAVTETIPNDQAKKDSILFINETYNKIQQNLISYKTFAGKFEVDYEDGEGKKYEVNAHIRMYADSLIWISVTGLLGIEGLRILVKADSVKMLDKQNKIYTGRSISFIQDLTGMPLDLSTLQDLLIGNPVFLEPQILSYKKTDENITLQNNGHVFKNLFTISRKDYLVRSSKLDDINPQRNRTCYLNYHGYENKKGVNFSTKRKIQISEKKKLDIDLEFKQYEFNETLTFPFNVPKNYDEN
ncbi:MAG: DUF4292 domain-containing protein [Chitinophagaceae bacterium]